MIRSFKITGIDCANCAAKMERRIAKVKGVEDCSIVFMTETLYLEADDGCFDRVLDDVISLINKYEPSYKVNV